MRFRGNKVAKAGSGKQEFPPVLDMVLSMFYKNYMTTQLSLESREQHGCTGSL